MLTNPKDLFTSGSIRFVDAITNGTSLLTITSQPDFRKYDLTSLNQTNTSLSIVASPGGITLITQSTAVVVSSTTSQVDFIDINTNAKTAVTTGATTCWVNSQSGQVAGNTSTGIAIATKSTTGSVQKITSGQVLSSLSPTGLSGANATFIITKGDNFLLGTSNGKVIEIDSSGTVAQTITLPTTPNVGTTPTPVVSGLSYYSPNLAVATQHGLLYVYEYGSSTLIYTGIIDSANSSNAGTTLCTSISGYTVLGRSTAPTNITEAISEFYFSNNSPIIESTYYNDSNSQITGVGLDINNKSWSIYNTSSNFLQLRTHDVGPLEHTLVETRAQDPAGSDITARIIRIRGDIGKSCVDLDSSITTTTNLDAVNGHPYFELAIKSGSPDKYDFREFMA